MASLGNLLATTGVPAPTPTMAAPVAAQTVAPTTATPAAAAPTRNPIRDAWKTFITNVQTDPNFRQALLQTGIGLMQSPQMGQNNWDVAANALNRGVTTLDTLRQRDKAEKERLEKEKFDREQEAARTGAYVKTSDAQVAESGSRVKIAGQQEERAAEKAEYEKTQRKRAEELADAVLDTELAKASNYRASAERDRAAAKNGGSLAGNSTGRKTNLEYAVEILASEYEAQGFTPEQARVKAVREYNSKKTSLMEEFIKFREGSKNLLGIEQLRMSPAEMEAWEAKVKADYLALKEKETQFVQQQNIKQNLEQATGVGRFVPVMSGGKEVQAEVVGLVNGRYTLRLPNGTVKTVSANQFENTYGKQ